MANKAIKYRVYPTTEQKIMFAKTFGCCRKVYNLMLCNKKRKARSGFPKFKSREARNSYTTNNQKGTYLWRYVDLCQTAT